MGYGTTLAAAAAGQTGASPQRDRAAELQGSQKAIYKIEKHNDEDVKVLEGFEPVSEGTLSSEEFDQVARDLTAFLSYVGEPIQMKRKSLGIWVLLFIAGFSVVAYKLKKEYWKDVH